MSITIACPCGRKLQIADAFAGQQGRCPVCGRTLDLPMPTEAELQPVAADAASIDKAVDLSEDQIVSAVPRFQDAREPSSTDFLPERDLAPPAYKLFSAGDATVAAFLGSVLAGSLIVALNYRKLGRKGAAVLTLLLGLAAFLVHFTIATTLPEPASAAISVALTIVGLVVVYAIAKRVQGAVYEEHLRLGGQKASTGRAAGIGLLCGLLLFAVVVALSLGWESVFNDLGERIVFGTDEEIYYAHGVTEGQARSLGRFLQQDGFFNGRGAKTVTVARDGNAFIVSFVVVRNTWNEPNTLAWCRNLIAELSDHVFGGAPVEIRLVDENLSPQKTIK